MEHDVYGEEAVNTRRQTKYIHEGRYVAEVDVDLIETEDEWAPYMSVDDAYKLDEVRAALRRKDIAAAARSARVFTKHPVAI